MMHHRGCCRVAVHTAPVLGVALRLRWSPAHKRHPWGDDPTANPAVSKTKHTRSLPPPHAAAAARSLHGMSLSAVYISK